MGAVYVSEVEELTKTLRYVIVGMGVGFTLLLGIFGFYQFMSWWTQTHPPQVKVVSLPYTLSYNGMRVTFKEVYLAENYTGVYEYRVVLVYRNTLHESNSNYYLPGLLKLKTDKGNIYEIIEEYEPSEYFKPQEERVVEGYSWISKSERPVALIYYEEIWGNYLPILEIRISS